MNRIVVVGAEGTLGSELCRQLGSQAVGVDLPEFDLAGRDSVAAKLDQIGPQAVINAAAFTQIDQAEEESPRCQAVNAEGVGHLVECCRRLDCVLVQVSTDYVFGGDAGRAIPYTETDPPAPLSVYGKTKLEGESRAAGWERHFIVRTCGLYGLPGARAGDNFVETILRMASRGERLRVVNDQRCTPSYTGHIARGIRFLLSTGVYGTYHLVNRGETTWFDFATEILRRSGIDVAVEPVTTEQYGARAPRPHYSVLSTAKYHALPDRPTMPRWQDALSQYLAIRGAH
jgi:dTDP-4-dehydrorhamnose reductase